MSRGRQILAPTFDPEKEPANQNGANPMSTATLSDEIALRIGLAARMPWVVAFIFGLLHGFGFAGALNEIGLPENAIPLALAFFNIGVEIGQLLFIAAFFIFMWLMSKVFHKRFATDTNLSPTWAATARLSFPVAYMIGSLAAYWLIERTVSFWA